MKKYDVLFWLKYIRLNTVVLMRECIEPALRDKKISKMDTDILERYSKRIDHAINRIKELAE